MYKFTIQIPPIRTPLTEMDLAGAALSGNAPQPTNTNGGAGGTGTNQPPRTAKEWYRFWYQAGAQINANSNLVSSGSHAARPDPANTPDGALYCETDRGVIYQLRNGQWWYVAGTMYGPLNPDTRPGDLGNTDGGFEFRSTDSAAPYADRQFIWSQTAWIEVTPVRYGTQGERLAAAVNSLADQMLWVETDTGNLIYQLQSGSWVQVGAAPAPPPPQVGDAQITYASAALTLTTAYADIPGCQIALNRAGRYLVTGSILFQVQADDANWGLRGQLIAGGAAQYGGIWVAGGAGAYLHASQQWLFSVASAGESISLQASKDGGAGTTATNAVYTSVSALWISP